jgi:regulator of extracellular matrix RemA (YlzA/DUF370 family)
MTDVLNLGYGNYVMRSRVVMFGKIESSPTKRLVANAKDQGTCVDMTAGHRVRCAIILDTGHIVITSRVPKTIAKALGYYGDDTASSDDSIKVAEQCEVMEA